MCLPPPPPQINPSEASDGRIIVTAYSPLHRPLDCPVSCTDGVYSAKFQPDEVGEWKIHVTYEGQHIQGSPFNCFVYDPHAVRVGASVWLVLARQSMYFE